MSFTTFATNPEANDTDYEDFQALLDESLQHSIQTEQSEAEKELRDFADQLEKSYPRDEEIEELVEMLRFTADQNPISETAEYLKTEAYKFL